VCNRPSVRIRPAIRPERSPAATVFVDIAVPRMYSYRRVRSPLEVNLTWTGTHLWSWVTCTSSTARHGAMAVKPEESTRNATLNDSCHTIPCSHLSTGDCGNMVHWRSRSARRDVPGLFEHQIWTGGVRYDWGKALQQYTHHRARTKSTDTFWRSAISVTEL
jgi:hypothetical protein